MVHRPTGRLTIEAAEPTRASLERQLAALAAGLCHDASIQVEVADGETWAWDPARRVITVSGKDLEERGHAYCAGILAHEVGHFYVSRYLHLAEVTGGERHLGLLLNAIEDPRCETWIRRRYPGTGPWLAEANAAWVPPTAPLPFFVEFCLRCALEGARGWENGPGLPAATPEVAAALDTTRDARRRYAETLPLPDLSIPVERAELAPLYRNRAWPRLLPPLQRHLPEPREQAVRIRAVEAFDLARAEVFPAALGLQRLERDRLAAWIAQMAERRRRARLAVEGRDGRAAREMVGEAREAPLSSPAPGAGDLSLADDLLRLALEAATGKGGASWAGPRGPSSWPLTLRSGEAVLPGTGAPPPPREPRPESRPQGPARPLGPYESALDRLGSQVDTLTRTVDDVLRPRRRLGLKAGYPSGARVSLSRLMQFEADPRRYGELWYRKTLPERKDAAILLLVDLSGSMRGERTDAALLGTVLLAEVLSRLSVPFGVYGFQDELIPFLPMGEPLDAEARRAIASMPLEVSGSRTGGRNMPSWNDDGPCLREAAAHLLERHESDRVLVAISDGLPAGCRSTDDDLTRAVADLSGGEAGLELIGVGLGPGTEHVRRFYPEAVADVPLERFAEEIGDLLNQVLTGRPAGEQTRRVE